MSNQGGTSAGAQSGPTTAGQAGVGTTGENELFGHSKDRLTQSAKFGGVVYVISAFGLFLTAFFAFTMLDDDGVAPFGLEADLIPALQEESLYFAASLTYSYIPLFTILGAVGFALYFYSRDDIPTPTAPPAAIAVVTGTVVAMILMLILALIFEPSGLDISLGDEVPLLIAMIIGTSITASLAGFVLDNQDIGLD